MSDVARELLEAVHEIRDLLRVVAEPALAARDKGLRSELSRIVRRGSAGSKAVMLMNGTRTQTEIHREAPIDKGQLSALVKKLAEAKLLAVEIKKPKLLISIPPNFFDNGAADE